MTKLSKYQLKQLTPAELADYENGLRMEDNKTTSCYGGEVIISEDANNYGWKLEAWDNDGYLVDSDWGDTRDDVEAMVAEFVNILEEYEDDTIYGEEDDEE